MKFIDKLVFVLCFVFLCQLTVTAELVIKIDPANIDSADKKTGETAGAEEEKESKPDIIRFQNNDVLHGEMISIDPQKGIVWKSHDVLNNILFKTVNVKKIDLGSATMRGEGCNAAVMLTNDDILGGKLVSMDEENLVLDTQYAGIIKIDRHMIQGIFPGENNSGLLYSGPKDIDEWSRPESKNKGKITVSNGTLSMTGYCSIGRDMKLGEMSKIEFSFEIAGNCQMQVLFYGNKVTGSPKDCYALYLSAGYIYLQRYGKHRRSGNLGNVQCQALRKGRGKIILLLDRKDKKVTLLVNDTMVKQWVDTKKGEDGTFVCFVNQSQGALKIKDIEVSQWNGKIPGSKNTEEDKKKDLIIFINSDQVTGELKTIAGNEAVFKTEYAELKIPLKRIKQIRTATEKQRKARRNAGDVRFQFINGDKLTLDLAKIANAKITGKSENFGNTALSLKAFKAIEINIYEDD